MAKENEIVEIINSKIQSSLSDKRFEGSVFNGISISVQDGVSIKPCIVNNDGECEDAGADDNSPLQIYHRNNGCSFKQDTKGSFGDQKIKTQISNMSMFVIAQRKKLELTPEDLLTLIQSAIPDEVSKTKRVELKIITGNINVISSDMNAQAVFKREYQIKDKILDPQVNMFELRYQIECSYSKDCINTICCP